MLRTNEFHSISSFLCPTTFVSFILIPSNTLKLAVSLLVGEGYFSSHLLFNTVLPCISLLRPNVVYVDITQLKSTLLFHDQISIYESSYQTRLLTALAILVLWSSGNKVKIGSVWPQKHFIINGTRFINTEVILVTSLKCRPICYQCHGLVLLLSHLVQKELIGFIDLASLNLAHYNIHWQSPGDPKQFLRYDVGLSVYPDCGSIGHIFVIIQQRWPRRVPKAHNTLHLPKSLPYNTSNEIHRISL